MCPHVHLHLWSHVMDSWVKRGAERQHLHPRVKWILVVGDAVRAEEEIPTGPAVQQSTTLAAQPRISCRRWMDGMPQKAGIHHRDGQGGFCDQQAQWTRSMFSPAAREDNLVLNSVSPKPG